MAFITALDTVKVVLNQLFGNQELANIIYFLKSGGWSEADMTALAADIEDWWTDEIAPWLSSALSLVGIDVVNMETDNAPSISRTVSPAVPGLASTEAVPANAAGVVTFRTANRGRSSRGRNYLGGLTIDTIEGVNEIGANVVAGLIQGYEALSTIETGNSCEHVVASFYHLKQPRSTALLQEVLSYTMDNNVDSQRRRLNGRGV